jgi:hypothetical protein
MSAVSARSVSRTLGVGQVRALRRVLYRCAKQDREHRFHVLVCQVARSDRAREAGCADCVCQPVNDVGEPCAGEPHARFDVAAGGKPRSVGKTARQGKPPADPTKQKRIALVLQRAELVEHETAGNRSLLLSRHVWSRLLSQAEQPPKEPPA